MAGGAGALDDVFRAVFVDLKTIKTRNALQLIFEVDLEAGDDALEKLGGLPRPDTTRWVAIARLMRPAGANSSAPAEPTGPLKSGGGLDLSEPAHSDEPLAGGASPPSPREDQLPVGLALPAAKTFTLANRIGMLCRDPLFKAWITHSDDGTRVPDGEVAEMVRNTLQVRSRADVEEGSKAADAWERIERAYWADWEKGKT